MLTATARPDESTRHNLLTLASIGVVACVAADMVHEALGHGIASWLTGDSILSISTVAIQNATANRFVSAAGSTANCGVGAISLLLLRREKRFTSYTYFLWLFGAFNLLNSGYLVVSSFLQSGDWASVIAGLAPPLLWRCVLALSGSTLYFVAIRWIASSAVRLSDGAVGSQNTWRLVLPAYIAGGAVMTIASVFNPISPSLILLSGAGASFGLNSGLLFIPAMVAGHAERPNLCRAMPFSIFWLVLALVFGGIFVAILGPGIHLPH